MGKYGKSIGYWEHNLAGIEHKLKPIENDNLEFLKLKGKAQKVDDESILFKGVGNIYFNMVLRAYPELTEEDQIELAEVIGQNIPLIVNDMMIAFKWTTAEELEKMKQQQLKKNVNP